MESDVTPKEDCIEIEIPFHLFQYLSTANCNLHNLCRICLSENNEKLFPLISVGDTSLQDMFTWVTSIQVCPNDGLPSHICQQCHANVVVFNEFKNQSLKSDRALKSLLKGEFAPENESSNEPVKSELEKPATVSDVPLEFEVIKREDIQYLEDLSGSDTEALCIIQSTEEANKTCVEQIEDTEKIIPLFAKDDLAEKSKEKTPRSHICSFCHKRFRNSKAVKSHVARIHGGAAKHPHSCAQCKESFETQHDLDLHAPIHGPGPVWACSVCHKGFKGRSMFRRHILRHMECKRYSCESCGKPFAELYALRRHSRVHTGEKVEKRHACHLCEKRYSNSNLLKAHIARHGDVRPCVCTVCGKAFPSTRLLLSHHRVHQDDKPHSCRHCEKRVVSFPSTRLLLSHHRVHQDDKPHSCRHCEKRFRHESTLRTHERTHTGERPYVCAVCGKRFIQNSNLTLHMRTHTGDRPYSCDTCGRSFSSGSTLKTHLVTHTGEKPYECRECGKRFARKDMRAHMRLHSGERPHTCSVCARRFPTAVRLRDHCRVHTGEKPFECAQCSLKFGSKSHLVKHVKTHQVKKKRVLFRTATYTHEKRPEKEDIDVERGGSDEGMDTKEVIVEATHDLDNVTEEVVIHGQESQADVPTPLRLTEVNTGVTYPQCVNVVTIDPNDARVDSVVKLYQVNLLLYRE
ncbi:zinc-finger double domain-containing protein [Phthorimaea operculella]|nr:zinc-finger double domain-containing protein [Phthorimaea operculella]